MNAIATPERRAFALRVAVLYAAGAAAWIFGSDMVVLPLVGGTDFVAAASMLKGSVFVGISGLILYLFITRNPRAAFAIDAAPSPATARGAEWRHGPLPWFVLLAVALMGALLWLYLRQDDFYRTQALLQTGARAEVKAEEVGVWLRQRAETAQSYRSARFLQDDLAGMHRGEPAAMARVERRLEEIRRVRGLESMLVLDAAGATLAAVGPLRTAPPELARDAQDVARTRNERLQVLRRAPPGVTVALDQIVPINHGGAAPAVLVLRDAADSTLFPIIRHWPVPSRSAEAYLMRETGGRVEYLSELRRDLTSALSLGPSVADSDHVGARMLRGETGTEDATDYRGTAVIAASRPVSGTDWRMVAKIDLDEVLAPARTEAWQFIPVILGLTVLAALGAGMLWRQETRIARLREQSIAAEREVVGKHLDLLSRHANDIILLIDSDGDIVEANEKACVRYGYAHAELIGMPAHRLRATGAPGSIDERLAEVKLNGGRIFESLHVTRSGEAFPIEISARRIGIDGADYVQAIIRDITERKHAYAALAESEERFRSLFEMSADAVLHGAPDGTIFSANPAACRMFGRSEDEMRDAGRAGLVDVSDPRLAKLVKERNLNGSARGVTTFVRKDGAKFAGEVSSTNYTDRHGNARSSILIRDVSERERAQAALLESEERFRAVLEQSIVAVYVIQDGRLVYVNPRMREIFGYPPDGEFDPNPLAHIAPHEHARVMGQMMRRLAGEPQAAYSVAALRRDGTPFTLGLHAARATYDGKPAIIAVAQDISEKLRAEGEIERFVARLKRAVQSTIEVVSTIGELRDPYTHGHERRVGEVAAAIASEMGLPEDRREGVLVAGYLHDVGKIAVPAEILSKPTKLSKAEFDLVKQHAQQSYDILKNVDFPWPVAEAAWQHHERMDGTGYPRGLKGEEIIVEARILAVADTVEAMASHRPYRPGLGIDKALAEIERGRGKAFDPQVADACLRLFREKNYKLPD